MSDFPICIGKKDKSKYNIFLNILIVVLLVVILAQFLFYERFSRVYVVGSSMSPTLCGAASLTVAGGDYVYIDKYAVPDRGDIVVLSVNGTVIIKRVIAVGGDTVQLISGVLYLNGEEKEESYVSEQNNTPSNTVNTFEEITVEEGFVFFMGDNRDVSQDSRNKYGPVSESCVMGVVTSWSLDFKNFLTAWNTFFDFKLKFARN